MAGIQVPVGIKNAQWKAGLDDMRKDAKKFASDIKGEFVGSFSGIKGQIVGAFGLAAIGTAVGSLLSKAGAIQDMSERFDASAESLQRIGNVAAQNGSSMEAVGAALNKTALAQEAARESSAEHLAALEALKITADEFINLTPEQAFYRIADATATAEDRQSAYAAVIKLMGKSSGELFTTLEMGGAAIRDLGESIGVYSDEAIARLDEMGDALDASKSRFAVAAGGIMLWIDKAARSVGATIGGMAVNAENMWNGRPKDDSAWKAEMDDIWNPKAKEKAKKPRRDVEDKAGRDKASSDAERRAAKIASLAERLAEIQHAAALEEMTAEKRISTLIDERYALLLKSQNLRGVDAEQELEAKIKAAQIDKQIGEEQKKLADSKARAKSDEQKTREQHAKELATALQAERDQAEELTLSKMSPAQQRAALKKKSDNLYGAAAESEAKGDSLGASKQRLEAARLLERMDGIADPAKTAGRIASVNVDSLQAVGGGGGIGAGSDPQLRRLDESNRLLSRIAGALENRNPAAPRPQPK